VILVRGKSLLPVPPAKTTPFIRSHDTIPRDALLGRNTIHGQSLTVARVVVQFEIGTRAGRVDFGSILSSSATISPTDQWRLQVSHSLLAVAEARRLIRLKAFAWQVPHGCVQIPGANRPNLHQEFQDGVFSHSRRTDGRVYGTAFNEASDDLGAACGIKPAQACSYFHYACSGRQMSV